ncbi:MAG: hypothetical protein U1F71_01760 [Verrucomicrobiaceae bacterium]
MSFSSTPHSNGELPLTTRHSRLFYSIASIVLLVLTLIGFRMFYLHLQAFPGRPLTPPIRTLLIVHGVSMTIWMLLSGRAAAAGRRRAQASAHDAGPIRHRLGRGHRGVGLSAVATLRAVRSTLMLGLKSRSSSSPCP